MIDSDASAIEGPVYLDASAWVKLYVQELHSDALNAALLTRQDVFVSDVGATEVASALGRACREGRLDRDVARRLHRRMRQHLRQGVFQRLDLTPRVHAAAERWLLTASVPTRAGDALHLALATTFAMETIVSYDPRLNLAARSIGLLVATPGAPA